MALATNLWRRMRALFGEADTSTFDVEAEVKRAFDRTLSLNLDPSTNAVINTTKRHVLYALNDMTVTGVKYVPDAAVTANATNFANIKVLAGTGAAAAATVVATVTTQATNMAAGTPYTVTLSSTAANLDVDAGETLACEVLKGGAGGVALAKGALVIHYRER